MNYYKLLNNSEQVLNEFAKESIGKVKPYDKNKSYLLIHVEESNDTTTINNVTQLTYCEAEVLVEKSKITIYDYTGVKLIIWTNGSASTFDTPKPF